MEKWERCAEMIDHLTGCVQEMDEMLGMLKDTVKELTVPRVLTLEEVLKWEDSVWVEEKNGDVYLALINRIWEDRKLISVRDVSHYHTTSGCEYRHYGRLIRYWTAKPTPEQQAETEWIE